MKIQRKLLTYWIAFLMIAVAGCSDLPVVSTGRQGIINKMHIRTSKSHIADVDDMDTDAILHEKEVLKERIKATKRGVYLLDTHDILDIETFEEPDLTMTLKVADNGTIVYPLIGAIEVKGLSTQEAEEKLEKLLRDGGYLKNPQIAIKLNLQEMKRWGDKEIYVMGEVRRPNAIPILGKNITVLEAIAKAEGFTDFAAPNRTKVIRVEDGVEKTVIVDLNKAKKGDRSLDIILQPGDLVVVPETHF